MKLRGIPTRDDFDMDGHDVSIIRDHGAVVMEFKVVSADQGGREAFEVLSALAVNNPARIRFELWADDDDLWLQLRPTRASQRRQRREAWVLGKVPMPVKMFVTLGENWKLFEKFGEVFAFGLSISLVGKEIDRDRVMSIADDGDLDVLSERQFDELISGMKCMMNQEAVVVTIRLRLSPDNKTGKLPSWENREVIDV